MKMPRTCCSLALIAIASIAPAPLAAQQEVDNVAAFARLYGVARWFYPSDAAAALDWNRFAVHGVSRAKSARTPAELERTLEELFTPLGPGIEIGAALPPKRSPGNRDASLIAWRYRGPGFAGYDPYSMKRTNRFTPAPNALGTLSQSVRADTLRGKTIRLRAHVRVADPAAQGRAGLWLRVDRDSQTMRFYDNMLDRPARDTAWREYVIEGPVAPDATRIVFGLLARGPISVDVDAMELSVRSEDGSWSPLAIADASFETEGSGGWAQRGNHEFTRPTSAPAKGERLARIAPVVAGAPEPPADTLEVPVEGASVEVELTRGLRARVRLSLTDAEARNPSPELPALAALRAALATVANPSGRDDVDVRLADAVVGWNVYRHFYPYWMDIAVDWDARLRPHLATALDVTGGREAHFDAVRALVADVRDGHGWVDDNAAPLPRPALARVPLQLRIIGEKLVVTASSYAGIPVGSVVIAMDGVTAEQRVVKDLSLWSGTLQWRRSWAEDRLSLCRRGVVVNLTTEAPSGATHAASLPCTSPARPDRMVTESRPDTIAELQPGVWYVDLTRLWAASLGAVLEKVANAKAVVFDMRGRPTDIGRAILPHLMSVAEDSTDRWMHVSRIVGPFGQIAGWQSLSWNLKPAVPHITARRVFLTDGRAISYAESVMGYVRDHKLGTIVGGRTAGANGDVVQFTVPGGFSISFTGLRVTRHDGRTPFHMLGVGPDILIEPTLAGIRAGRDEVLERALSLLRILP
jgi:hypothetical protein